MRNAWCETELTRKHLWRAFLVSALVIFAAFFLAFLVFNCQALDVLSSELRTQTAAGGPTCEQTAYSLWVLQMTTGALSVVLTAVRHATPRRFNAVHAELHFRGDLERSSMASQAAISRSALLPVAGSGRRAEHRENGPNHCSNCIVAVHSRCEAWA